MLGVLVNLVNDRVIKKKKKERTVIMIIRIGKLGRVDLGDDAASSGASSSSLVNGNDGLDLFLLLLGDDERCDPLEGIHCDWC